MKNNEELVVYQSKDGSIELAVKLENENIWLTQKQMSGLFNKDVKTVNRHIINIYKEGELEESSTISKNEIVQTEGGREIKREISLYNLDVIISVGYRVHSKEGTRFRIWATKILREHIIKGYTFNEHRIQQLEERQNAKDVNDRVLRDILNKFLAKMARKEVLDAVIDELEITKNDISVIKKYLNIENK